MANTKAVNFAEIKANEGVPYAKPVQILDNDGNVVNEELMANFSDELLVDLMKKMVWARALHEQTMSFSKQGRLGFYAPTWGEEASEMGTAAAFKKQDFLFPAYRDLPQLIQHGATVAQMYLWSKGHIKGNLFDARALRPQIIIGAQMVEMAGGALGIKKNGEKDTVAYAYTGEGGSSQGDTYEGMNFAGAFQVPGVFIIQNNGGLFRSHESYKLKHKQLPKRLLLLEFQVSKLMEWMSLHVMKLLKRHVNLLLLVMDQC